MNRLPILIGNYFLYTYYYTLIFVDSFKIF